MGTFMDVTIGVGGVVGFIALCCGAVAALWIGAYEIGGWSDYRNPIRAWAAVVTAVALAVPITAGFIVWGAAVWTDDTPATFSVPGGLGPDTVCWYALVDDDKVVGKVVIDGSEQRTVCNLTPDAIPAEVRSEAR